MSASEVTWFGHATVLVERDGTRVITDPLLRPSLMKFLRRRHEAPELEPESVDAVLISHVHHDHLDLPTLRTLSRHVPVFVPVGAAPLLTREGFVAVTEFQVGDEVVIGGLRIQACDAVHAAVRRRTSEPPSLGYLFGDPGSYTYFAGDTELFDGMEAIAAEGVDLALLPVWGWGPTLGPGHMDPDQAAEALARLRAARAVPIHWGTYTPFGAGRLWPWMAERPPREFAESAARLAPEAAVTVLQPGESIAAEL
jgi:L-ascorbate metabolism protein UlaG (beta-lactamase superfamily)